MDLQNPKLKIATIQWPSNLMMMMMMTIGIHSFERCSIRHPSKSGFRFSTLDQMLEYIYYRRFVRLHNILFYSQIDKSRKGREHRIVNEHHLIIHMRKSMLNFELVRSM